MHIITEPELAALGLLRQAAVTAGRQLQTCEQAVNAYLQLLQAKYGSKIDFNTGEILPPPAPPSTPDPAESKSIPSPS
jgi:hypothetical protein